MLTTKDITRIRERYCVNDWERLAVQLGNNAIVPVDACRVIEMLCDELERRILIEDDLK